MLMMDLDADFMGQFSPGAYSSAAELSSAIGLSDLIPGAILDDKIFEPCGYSLNAIVKVSVDQHSTMACMFGTLLSPSFHSLLSPLPRPPPLPLLSPLLFLSSLPLFNSPLSSLSLLPSPPFLTLSSG